MEQSKVIDTLETYQEGRGRWRPPFLSPLRRGRKEGLALPPFLSLGLSGLVEGRTTPLWAGLSLPLAH